MRSSLLMVPFVALATLAAGRARAHPESVRDHGFAGVTAHVVGIPAPLGSGVGFGASFRIHPLPNLALDLGFEALRGNDDYGHARRELPLNLLALVYFNPGSPL